MEDRRRSKSRVLLTLYISQMLLISAGAQGPTPTPNASPVSPVDGGPPAPPSEPSPVATPTSVQRLVTNMSFVLTVVNSSFTGRQTTTALTSPTGEYALALVMDGFGIDANFQYCWTEIHNSLGNLTFRENCRPPRVQKCTLSFTEKGDLRLTLESRSAKLVSWRTDTEDKGVVEVKLDDTGVVTLVKTDETVVWTSADDKDRCLDPYNPANGVSESLGFSTLVIVSTTVLSLALLSCLW